MDAVISKVSKLFFSSFDETALISGISDILVVKWSTGQCLSTPFLVCFGTFASMSRFSKVRISVNGVLIKDIYFHLDKFGYIQPMKPNQEIIEKLNLQNGRNTIGFEVQDSNPMECEIYLYSDQDKLLVSDVDGTMTKNDLGGLLHNIRNKNYLHDGYYQLIQKIEDHGYRIVWLTMRSMALYNFSKDYIKNHTKVDGILLTEPQEFFPSFKKQILKQTSNIKANMMIMIKSLFPPNVNPFIGGLGNRENDAIAYIAAGIKRENIYIVDTNSQVHHFGDNRKCLTYRKIFQEIEKHFPRYRQMQISKRISSNHSKKDEMKKRISITYFSARRKQTFK